MSVGFSITREVLGTDRIGCTQFQTTQTEGQTATSVNPQSGGGLDGDIVWYIDANPGYVVQVGDFSIPNTTEITAPTYKSITGSGLPTIVNGVSMEQISDTRIKVTIFLIPSAAWGITGSAFVMPGNDVNEQINIQGCAKEKQTEGDLHFKVSNNEGVTTTTKVLDNSESDLKLQDDGTVKGELPNKGLRDIVEHTVTIDPDYRFVSPPKLRISNSTYYAKESVEKNENGEITSVTFTISKNL